MEVLMRTGGIAETNCFVIADEVARKAVLFDAPNDTTAAILDEVQTRGWDLIGLWLTHGHFDHLADHAVVTGRFPDAELLMHPLEVPKLAGNWHRIIPLPFEIPSREPDGYLQDGQKRHIGSIEVQVMHTPGHACGHVVFYLPKEKLLVGGDMIIGGSIGRVDLPDSDYAQMRKSLRRIMELPEETQLLPGHGAPTLLRQEMQRNCMLQEAIARTA